MEGRIFSFLFFGTERIYTMDIQLGSKKPKGRFELDSDATGDSADLSLGPRKHAVASNLPTASGPVDDMDAFMNPHKEREAADVPPPTAGRSAPVPDFGEEEGGGEFDDGYGDYEGEFDEGYEGEYAEPTEQPSKGYEDVDEEKVDLLTQIARYEAKGNSVKKLDMRSNIQDVRVEYRRIQEELGIQTSLKFSRRALMACVTGMEYLNHRFDPFKVKLDGWSEQTYESIEDYDNVFEKLHRKWAKSVEVAPEIELLMMVGSSAFMFHLTQSFFTSSGAGASIGGNPNLMREIMKTMSQSQQKQPSVPGMSPSSFQPPPQAPPRGPEPASNGGDMPGPSIDLSAFPMPPQMSTGVGNAEEKLKSLREVIPPDPSSAPPPKAMDTKKQDGVFEDDLGDLDSLAGSDLDPSEAMPEPSEPPKPKKRPATKKRGPKAKTLASDDTTIEI